MIVMLYSISNVYNIYNKTRGGYDVILMSDHRQAMHVISIEERTTMAGYDGLSRGEPLLGILLLQSFKYRSVIAHRATFAYTNTEPYIRIFVQLSTVLVIVHSKE